MHRNRALPVVLMCGALLLAGCANGKAFGLFGRAPAAPAPQVTELLLQLPAYGPAPVVLQSWERNTLVVDLLDVPGSGSLVLLRRADRPWPARIAFRMSSRRFEMLEVRGLQRVLFPVSDAGNSAVLVELPPGIYDDRTVELPIRWGARGSL